MVRPGQGQLWQQFSSPRLRRDCGLMAARRLQGEAKVASNIGCHRRGGNGFVQQLDGAAMPSLVVYNQTVNMQRLGIIRMGAQDLAQRCLRFVQTARRTMFFGHCHQIVSCVNAGNLIVLALQSRRNGELQNYEYFGRVV